MCQKINEDSICISTDVIKYERSTFFRNLYNSCMSVHTLLLLSWVHSLGLGLDLENSLDRREGESACALIHDLQSFHKKSDSSYLTTTHQPFSYKMVNTKIGFYWPSTKTKMVLLPVYDLGSSSNVLVLHLKCSPVPSIQMYIA